MARRKKKLGLADVVARFLRDVETRGIVLTTSTYRQRLGVLVRLLADLCEVTMLDDVDVDHLRQCVHYLLTNKVDPASHSGRKLENGSTLDPNTVGAYIRVWKVFFNWCFQEELLSVNPVLRLSSPRKPKKIKPTFTEGHIMKMLDVCDTGSDLGFRNYVVLILLLDTGLRLSEIASLRIRDVHDTYIKILGKGRKEREIGIYPETGKLLWKYINKYRSPVDEDEPILFLNRSGKALGRSAIRTIIRSIKDKSGLEDIKVSAHIFRHTFAKMYLKNGGDLFKLSREMGHSDVQTTRIYLEDFDSVDAREDHTHYSPISRLTLKKRRARRQK